VGWPTVSPLTNLGRSVARILYNGSNGLHAARLYGLGVFPATNSVSFLGRFYGIVRPLAPISMSKGRLNDQGVVVISEAWAVGAYTKRRTNQSSTLCHKCAENTDRRWATA